MPTDRRLRRFPLATWRALALGLVVAPLLGAQSAAIRLADPALIAKGNQLFTKSCGVGYCHGPQGRAAGAPGLRERAWHPRELFDIIHTGRTGTTMPGFKDIYAEEELWSLVAYLISLGKLEPGSAASVELQSAGGVASLSEEARKGRELFFDLTNQKRCAVCHRLGSRGAPIGPDLGAGAAKKSAEQLRRDILEPNASIAAGFEQTVIRTSSGERISGVKKEESDQLVRIYDAAGIPPPLRTFDKKEISRLDSQPRSSMPGDYRTLYSREELDAIIAYLKAGPF